MGTRPRDSPRSGRRHGQAATGLLRRPHVPVSRGPDEKTPRKAGVPSREGRPGFSPVQGLLSERCARLKRRQLRRRCIHLPGKVPDGHPACSSPWPISTGDPGRPGSGRRDGGNRRLGPLPVPRRRAGRRAWAPRWDCVKGFLPFGSIVLPEPSPETRSSLPARPGHHPNRKMKDPGRIHNGGHPRPPRSCRIHTPGPGSGLRALFQLEQPGRAKTWKDNDG